MKKHLLSLLGIVAVVGASAMPQAKVVETITLAKGAKIQICEDAQGNRFKRLVSPYMAETANQAINPFKYAAAKRAAAAPTADESTLLSESFECDQITEGWLPEGWSKNTLATEEFYQWHVSPQLNYYYPTPADGSNYCFIMYSSDEQDEWLITPELTLSQNNELSYFIYFQPGNLFDLSYVDWEAEGMPFTEKHIAATMEVLIKEEGGEWNKIFDIADEYMDITSFQELALLTPMGMIRQTISLADYADKKVQIAFRYVGKDGDSMFLDAINIGLPVMEPSFSWDYTTLYWGTPKGGDWVWYPESVAHLPINTPITWTNTTAGNDNTTYTWNYTDPATLAEATSNDTDLTLTFAPNYTTAENGTPLYQAPILKASAPGAAEGFFAPAVNYYQAGGAPVVELTDGSEATFGLLPFNLNTEGLGIITKDSYKYEDPSIPIFGYNKDTERWWSEYTFGEDLTENDKCEVTALLNYLYVTEAPMVINGLWIHAKGQIAEDAEFVAEIIALDEDGVQDETVATATCKGSDMIIEEGGIQNYIVVPFAFEKPVTVSTNNAPAYIVKISGFNDPDNVTYFAPCQSLVPNADYLCFGWIEKSVTYNGSIRTSLMPLAYIEDAYGDCYNAFLINLDAYYPWLAGNDTEVELSEENNSVEIALDSYHAGEELTCTLENGEELPEWLHFSAAGRYNATKATFSTDGTETAQDVNVVISAPGVSKAVTVKMKEWSAISSINADNTNAISDVYTASGCRVSNTANLPAGVYIVRYANGNTGKMIVK